MPEFPFILEDVLASEVAPSLASLVKVGNASEKRRNDRRKET